MKKLITAFAFSITAIVSFAQSKITGFGKLQLGMSISDISELSNATRVSKKDQYYKEVYQNIGSKNYEITCDTTETEPLGSFDRNVREFQIGKFNLTDNIELTDITLKFYGDKLYSINIKDSKLKDLLTTKYGEGKTTIKTEDHIFQNGYGAKFTKTDSDLKIVWETGAPNVLCEYVMTILYLSDGKPLIVSFGHLVDEKQNNAVYKYDETIKAKSEKEASEKKKSDLNGF